MAPKYGKKEIRRAGERLVNEAPGGEERSRILEIVAHWRAAHLEPLHKTMQALEPVCTQSDSALLVGRLKRLDTIIDKLNRLGSGSKLDTLQDIAGCRLIARDENEVRRLVEMIQERVPRPIVKDYIFRPKPSGYRGIHLVCRYDSESYGYDNLRVEIQVRSYLQHEWATAVEIYDSGKGTSLKTGKGIDDENRYFQFVASLINHDTEDAARRICELKSLDKELDICRLLNDVDNSMYLTSETITIERSDSCVMIVDQGMQEITIEVYHDEEKVDAVNRYNALELAGHAGTIHLLARAASLTALRRAYPNYFSNISDFVQRLKALLT